MTLVVGGRAPAGRRQAGRALWRCLFVGPDRYVGFVSTSTLRFNYRLRPGVVAERALVGEWHRCRWLWNQLVCAGKRKPYKTHPLPGDKDLTEARARLPWLGEGSQNAQQQLLRTFRSKRARGARAKKLKKHHTKPTINYTRNGFSVKDGRLCLAKGVSIPVVWSRELPSPPSSVRVYQDSLGHWYGSFVVQVNEESLPECDAAIGIDWGVATIATATDPAYDLAHPQYGRRNAGALAKYQRRMARRKPDPGQAGSRGYKHAKRQAAKAAKKLARQRQDTARKWAIKIVADHGVIAVEDFRPKFLAKSKMARKSADAVIGATKTELISYAKRAGRMVVIVSPAYTTMTCSQCGTRAKNRLALSERTFRCHTCGYIAGRDRNAARTILALAGRGPTGPFQASADAVRHDGLPSGQIRRAG